uniref:MSP domain-containing protein n=1 Tax=Oncorhynchus kisutch TaxID=8019 RepID=A0A8C7LJR8_ONCKI
ILKNFFSNRTFKRKQETRKRSRIEYVQDSSDKYDSRDVDRLWKDDVLVDSYLEGRHFVLCSNSLFESGMHYLHGYDKEGNKLFWFRVKLHMKDVKMLTEKKMYVAFWLESYARREPGIPLTVIFDMSEAGLSCVVRCLGCKMNCVIYVFYFISDKMLKYEMPWIMNGESLKEGNAKLPLNGTAALRFVSKSDIQNYVDGEHLLSYMGGTYPIKFSYPPLPDDVFQNPIPETGQEDDTESKDDDLEAKDTLVPSSPTQPEMLFFVPLTTLLGFNTEHCYTFESHNPDDLCFGHREGEKRCLIMLSTVTKNQVAFKVRTTAPEKYRVKPSSSSCGAGESMEITVSLHGGFLCSPQDRFLIMAAEMEPRSGGGSADLAQFWKGVPKAKIMEHRLRCRMLEGIKSALSPLTDRSHKMEINGYQDKHTMVSCDLRRQTLTHTHTHTHTRTHILIMQMYQ